jgi:hypothetical protein
VVADALYPLEVIVPSLHLVQHTVALVGKFLSEALTYGNALATSIEGGELAGDVREKTPVVHDALLGKS